MLQKTIENSVSPVRRLRLQILLSFPADKAESGIDKREAGSNNAAPQRAPPASSDNVHEEWYRGNRREPMKTCIKIVSARTKGREGRVKRLL